MTAPAVPAGKPNWSNRTVFVGDNLDIMRGMNSESVELVYLDPPFNSKRAYAAPIGSKAAGAQFKDTWTLDDVDTAWVAGLAEANKPIHGVVTAAGIAHGAGMQSYLSMMAIRLLEIRRLLKPAGSVYLHCDPTANGYIRLLMDAIFGAGNMRNEIVWCYTGPGSPNMRQFNRKHDTIFWYAKGDRWTFNADAVRLSHKDGAPHTGGWGMDDETAREYGGKGKVPETWWAQTKGNGLAIAARSRTQYVGYPTQKPLALLTRIVKASSNEGDMVLDPFCGCATTLVAANALNRRWTGIDLSGLAVKLVKNRLRDRHGFLGKITDRTDIPRRTDMGELPHYRKHKTTLYGEQGGYCNGCGHHYVPQMLEVDRIVPRHKGGTDHTENLQLLCPMCNRLKGKGSHEELMAKLKRKGLQALDGGDIDR